MATDDPRAATVTDSDGREVVLLARIWEDKIARDDPDLVGHLGAVVETVAKPDRVEPTRCRLGRGSTGVASAPAAAQ